MTDTLWGIPGATDYRALVPEYWDKKLVLFRDDAMYWKKFIGSESDRQIIVQKNNLKKDPGDKITIGMQGFLSAAGIYGDKTLEASEEKLYFYDTSVQVNQIRNAVKDDGAMTRQRDAYSLHERAAKALGIWYARNMDAGIFDTIYFGWPAHLASTVALGAHAINTAQAKPPRYWVCADEANNTITYSATDATYESSIENAENGLSEITSDYMSPMLFHALTAKMKVLNFTTVMKDGFEGYLSLLHPYQVAQLRTHDKWFEAMRTGAPRDIKDNPLFSGALGYWDGCIIHESNKIHADNHAAVNSEPVIAHANADGNVRRAIFLGADALALGVAKEPHIIHKDDFDYFNQKGEAVAGIWGAVRGEYISDDSNSTVKTQSIYILSTYSPATTTTTVLGL